MFEIIDEKSKQIVVSVHLEQIYTVLKKATRLKERNQLFKEERWNIECGRFISQDIRIQTVSGLSDRN